MRRVVELEDLSVLLANFRSCPRESDSGTINYVRAHPGITPAGAHEVERRSVSEIASNGENERPPVEVARVESLSHGGQRSTGMRRLHADARNSESSTAG